MAKWEYHDIYKKYDMNGIINIGTGTVKVHDIFNPLPDFMKQADIIFCDPPCSKANINAFYTKADKPDEQRSEYESFIERLFCCISEIKPKTLVLETFKANHTKFLEKVAEQYSNIKVFDTTYYHKPTCKCHIIVASNYTIPELPFQGMDEENVIEWICKNFDYECIGDLCMGKGLVGYYSDKYGKKFVGTELNKKRLAVLLERINTKSRGNIN